MPTGQDGSVIASVTLERAVESEIIGKVLRTQPSRLSVKVSLAAAHDHSEILPTGRKLLFACLTQQEIVDDKTEGSH